VDNNLAADAPNMIRSRLDAVDLLLQEIPQLGVPTEEFDAPAGVAKQERRVALIDDARSELYQEIYARTGQWPSAPG
jgi:hypothetical protein